MKLFDPWTGVIFVLGHGHIGHIQVVQIFLEMMSKEWSMKIVKFRIPRAWFSWDMLWPYWYFKVNWKYYDPWVGVLVLGCGQFCHWCYQTKLLSLWSRMQKALMIWDSQCAVSAAQVSSTAWRPLVYLCHAWHNIKFVQIELGTSKLQSNK